MFNLLKLNRKKPFQRVVKESFKTEGKEKDYKISVKALECIQEATENFMIELFADAQYASLHAKRRIVTIKDVSLVNRVRDSSGSNQSRHITGMYCKYNRFNIFEKQRKDY